MLRIVSANVNGIRATVRRGGLDWLAASGADVVTLQEVRADTGQLEAALTGSPLGGRHVAHAAASVAGRAGVAVVSRHPFAAVRTEVGEEFVGAGRWVEVEVATASGPLTVASAYVHTGEAGTERQDEKLRFLDAVTARLASWADEGRMAVLTGDLNIAHTADDLKNWKGNRGKAGFLPDEQAYLDRWRDELGIRDVHRDLHGPGPGPYTWWSWRGKAFDNDAGWRIDYHWATAPLAARARSAVVGRAESYALRWSDHAPVIVDYDLA